MPAEYVPPKKGESAFNCPHCEAYSQQMWDDLTRPAIRRSGRKKILEGKISRCNRCEEYTIWVYDQMVYPNASSAPLPNEDMPEEVKKDFNEAREVVEHSPRSAAALLRLSMEKLTQDLTENEDQSLYKNIGELLEEGRIDERIQQALDSVRVTGNDMVHAGEIYEDDDRDTALRLFELVNVIVELTITRERMIEEAYSEIPENKMQGIEQRDNQ